MSRSKIADIVSAIGDTLQMRKQYLTVVESCTGGTICAAVTAVAGSSQWFAGGWVAYSNQLKHQQLQVPRYIMQQYGAVSEETVIALATNACRLADAHWSIATSGIAGPDGGSTECPVGTVWLAWAHAHGKPHAEKKHFTGNRAVICAAATRYALSSLLQRLM